MAHGAVMVTVQYPRLAIAATVVSVLAQARRRATMANIKRVKLTECGVLRTPVRMAIHVQEVHAVFAKMGIQNVHQSVARQ